MPSAQRFRLRLPCHAHHCHTRPLQHHSAHLSRCPNSFLERPPHASCSLIQCRQRDLVSLSISPMMCNTVSICRCQNPSMHATCFICVFRLSVLRSTKPPIRPGPIEKRQLCRISRLPAVNCSRSAEANPFCPRHSQLSVIAHAIAWVFTFPPCSCVTPTSFPFSSLDSLFPFLPSRQHGQDQDH